jgi:transcriptional regulator with XRE-family HTH domain
MHHETKEAETVAVEVRKRRQQRGWTLDAAAARLGVSRRVLVQLESGDANPSLSTLLAVADGFGISLVELLSSDAKPSVTLQSDNSTAPLLWTGQHGGEGRLLVGSGLLELWEWTLAPGDQRIAEAHQPNSCEALLVTAGAVTLNVGIAEPLVIRRGQSATFRADESHVYRNEGKQRASFVLAVHDPSGVSR